MKVGILHTGSGPIAIITSYGSLTDGNFLEALFASRIDLC